MRSIVTVEEYNLDALSENDISKVLFHRKMKKICAKVRKEIEKEHNTSSEQQITFTHFFARKATIRQLNSFSRYVRVLFETIEPTNNNGTYLFNRLFAKWCITALSNHDRDKMRKITKNVKKMLFEK